MILWNKDCHLATSGGARADRYVFFLFFTYYANVSIVISHFFSTTATSNATGGLKREERLETRLEPQGTVRFCFFYTYYTNVSILISRFFSTIATSNAT